MKFDFAIKKTDAPKARPDPENLGFGKYYTDHMFMMEYKKDKGWHNGRIVPHGPICLDPAASVFHYALEMFEGMKAFKAKDGRVLLFRPRMNARRMNITADRLCLAEMDEELFLSAVKAVVSFDKGWIPEAKGTSLYIRPFMIADEVYLGLRPSESFLFVIILSPVGSYYKNGMKPTKLLVEDEYTRAAPGGTGYAKVGGNYAATVKAMIKAQALGCDQVLWLDGIEKKYVEEVGASNAFFVIGGEVITPAVGDTILKGVTRDSVITLLEKQGYKVTERNLSIEEIFSAGELGKLDEAFATGTAASISPIGELVWKNRSIVIKNREIGQLSSKLYDELYGIQTGEAEDAFGWTEEV